ncbi:lycopene cyclase domain-containing protein [Natronomonas sp. CBA1123]|jgi:lycopene cyclase domain-containing protein|uniref:lycopene cyclase domain-containing protein n=1 Tax=Natronomonas sp. CBA1123 TaxID=2668070 RepID=UPI0012E99A82|nr:lycopene cyclase domain-containing protein [Natronomonas sp. CBA1123]MUV86239.1 lycopene cyclase domain-containing protein [Natronomonas sp. CBA1123]
MSAPTYAQFHFAFLLPVVAVLLAAATVTRTRTTRPTVWSVGRPVYWSGVAVVTLVAVVYTTPWDNYLIARGVWGYGEGQTFVHLGLAPLGEYAFFVLQPILTALWLGQLTLRRGWPEANALGRTAEGGRTLDVDRLAVSPRFLGGVAALAVGLVGVACLTTAETFYLGAILAWAAPVLFIQWVVGLPQLLYQRRTVALGVAVPTVYLWIIDRIALATGIWHISPTYTTGIAPFGLPIEEALFFLVTNLFVVQGLVLFRWVVDRWA